MSNSNEIVILRAYRPFLSFLSVYKIENFRNIDDSRILIRNFCYLIGVTLLITNYLCPFLTSELLVFIQSHFNLKTSGVQFSFFVGGTPTMSVHFLLIWKCYKIIDTLDYLHAIVAERCKISPQLLANYEANEERHTRITKIMIKVVVIVIGLLCALPPLLPLSYIILGYPEPDKWTLAMEYTTPLADVYTQYLIDWIVEDFVILEYYTIHLTSLVFYIGLSLYVGAMHDDLKIRLQEIHDIARHSSSYYAFKRNLSNEIKFHTRLYDVAENISNVMSPILFFLLISYALIFAVFLLNIEEIEEFNLTVYGMVSAFINFLMQLVIYCRLSENITEDLFASGDLFYESRWYQMPPRLQSFYIIPIQRPQKEFRLKGLGIIECSLRVCASIIRTALSYFLLMRTL